MDEKNFLKSLEEKMKVSLDAFAKRLAVLAPGRTSPALLENISVSAYGSEIRLRDIASVSLVDHSMLSVSVWDSGLVKAVERGIFSSDLGITPMTEGSVIRVKVPPMTEERRESLVKIIKKEAEVFRVAVRGLRRDAMTEISSEKKSGLGEDDAFHLTEKVQEITNNFVDRIDKMCAEREKDILRK